eukprot:CAMPEP_0183833230 /NCGR_PEP_ID=MMETSP0807_2-20130328/5934_1 /TAXON_ID=88271 /ORGANISM="Picocystis salinarum, Strain CCMP1897" /LENGTH=104 /DNA_ID=CAMNT_0026079121 /DNA_START=35 /DNA_END=349 /DNA_ORIENTATION=+
MGTVAKVLALLAVSLAVVRAEEHQNSRISQPAPTCENTVDAPCADEKERLVESKLFEKELEYACVENRSECKQMASGFYRYFPHLCMAEVRLGTDDACGCCVYE